MAFICQIALAPELFEGVAPGVAYPVAEGPTLYALRPQLGQRNALQVPAEFGVSLSLSEDPALVSDEERWNWNDDTGERYAQALMGNKIGGTPYFIQNTELPIEGDWYLLIQLDSSDLPFEINFGDVGVGYAFISKDGRVGKFLWQCH